MKSWIVRFASLYAFNVVVLLVIGLFTPARVGFHAIWAAVIMTLAEVFVKPFVQRRFSAAAAQSAAGRTRTGEAAVQGAIVLGVAAVVWALTLLLTRVSTGGSWFWAWVLPPVIITIGWFVYARVVTRVETTAGGLYDRAEAGIRGARGRGSSVGTAGSAPSAPSPSPRSPSRGTKSAPDGLTPEQRRLFDELG